MPARHFTYTDPSDIEGEPSDVAKVATQQIRRLAAVVAELSKDTYIQLRSAGIDPDDDNAVEAWLKTQPGRAAADLVWAARVFAEATRAL